MRRISICGVFHSKKNPFDFEFDDLGNIVAEPAHLPSGVRDVAIKAYFGERWWPGNGTTGLSDHSQCSEYC